MSKIMKAAIGLMVLAGMTQASDVSMGTFVKTETSAAAKPDFTSVSSGGFTTTYTNAPADTRWYAYSDINGGTQPVAVGESLEFSFDWASTQIKNVSSSYSAFSFGFDTGTGLFRVVIDTQPSNTFMNISRGDTYPFGSTTTMTNIATATSPLPDSSAWLVAGNTPTIKTTLSRTGTNDWTVYVLWGGQTYSAGVTGYAAGDGTVDQVWIGSGASANSYFNTGDNYTIANASVRLVITYALTVNGGTGSGLYTNGAQVAVSAGAPAAGKIFDRWIGDTLYLADSNSASTTVTMPGQAVAVTATYKDAFTMGSSTNATLSSLSSTGYTATYSVVPADTRSYAYLTLNGGTQAVAVGESLEFSFDWASTQIKNVSSSYSAFSFGFDTGTGLFRVMIDTQPANTFMNIGYNDTYPFGVTTTMTNIQTASSPLPDSSAWLVAGNTPTIKTTLSRTGTNDWTVSVLWGGQTYSASVAGYAAGDGTVDNVWIGSGANTNSYFDAGDNYTISDVGITLTAAYTLTVNGGTGGGSYTNGQQVVIAADAPVPGQTFDLWTGDTQYVASVSSSNTTVTMPAQAIALTATYKSTEQYTTNGTPYSWMDQYGLTNHAADDVLDQDNDGLKTWQEYIAGTVPTNSASGFKVAQSTRNTVTWIPVTGRVYSVYWSTNLVKGFTNLADNIVHPQGSYTNTIPNAKVNHYQVKVRLLLP